MNRRYSEDVEDTLVIKVDEGRWQLGFNGEEAPRMVDEHSWNDSTTGLDVELGKRLVESFVRQHVHTHIIYQLMKL
jgi:hypothetical protein